MNSWDVISIYESVDLVKKFYLLRHGRKLSTSKSKEVIAAIKQGKAYFESAKNASFVVKPVLLYYGTLSLSRATILFGDSVAREANLKEAHGLQTMGWGGNLGGDIAKLADLRIRTTEGTFGNLCSVTGNFDGHRRRRHDFVDGVEIQELKYSAIPAGVEFSIRDVLTRVVRLRDVYQTVFGDEPLSLFSGIGGEQNQNPDAKYINFLCEERVNLTSEEKFAQLFSIDFNQNEVQFFKSPSCFGSGKDAIQVRILMVGDGRRRICLPVLHQTKQRVGNISIDLAQDVLIWPFADKYFLSSFGILFLLSYLLGMLGRYFPSVWTDVLSGTVSGDSLYPLLVQSMDVIEMDIPDLVGRELQRVAS